MAELILPNDTNTLGNLLGGRLMHYIDLVGAMAAYRHARAHVVTASMDHIDFIAPVHVGDLLILKSSLNRAFRTSMEVGVKVWVEHTIDGTLRHVMSAYLTFVAVDQQGGRVQRATIGTGYRRRANAATTTQAAAASKPHASANARINFASTLNNPIINEVLYGTHANTSPAAKPFPACRTSSPSVPAKGE